MSDIVERLRAFTSKKSATWGICEEAAEEIEQLRAALEPFARNVYALSLSNALGHITREHLWEARRALEPKT